MQVVPFTVFGITEAVLFCLFLHYRLTVNMSVQCERNFLPPSCDSCRQFRFGPDCNKYCKNNTRYYCDTDGNKVCLRGMLEHQIQIQTYPHSDQYFSQNVAKMGVVNGMCPERFHFLSCKHNCAVDISRHTFLIIHAWQQES